MTFLLCEPGWSVDKPDVHNKWDDNAHTHPHTVPMKDAREVTGAFLQYSTSKKDVSSNTKAQTVQYSTVFRPVQNNTDFINTVVMGVSSKPNWDIFVPRVENNKFVSTQNSTSRSTRERDCRILIAIKIKASTAEGRWRNPV